MFPHQRSIDDDSELEEERRLCYVAVTRAMKHLHVSRVRRRRLAGQTLGGIPSRFLRDLPADCIENLVQPRPTYYNTNTEGQGPWAGRWNREGQGEGGRSSGKTSWVDNHIDPPAHEWSQGANSVPPPRRQSGARADGGELTVHYDELTSDLGLRIGAKLRHPKFGVGEVRGWQSAGGDVKVTMRFAAEGVKTILAKFLTKP